MPPDALDKFDHVHGQTDDPGLFRNDAEDIVTYPPAGVGAETVTEFEVKSFQRTQQTQITLLDKIAERHPTVAEFLGNADHQTQIRFHHTVAQIGMLACRQTECFQFTA